MKLAICFSVSLLFFLSAFSYGVSQDKLQTAEERAIAYLQAEYGDEMAEQGVVPKFESLLVPGDEDFSRTVAFIKRNKSDNKLNELIQESQVAYIFILHVGRDIFAVALDENYELLGAAN